MAQDQKKTNNAAATKAAQASTPKATAPKGVTKAGTPRQRAYRTYYALNTRGIMIRFPSYEERERAIKAGEASRLTAHEARERQTSGEQAVTLSAARAVSIPHNKTNPDLTLLRDASHSGGQMSGPTIAHGPANVLDHRDLVEAQILVDQAIALIATLKDKITKATTR